MHLNKVLSEPMHVTPLEVNEVAVFRLVGADRINPKTGEPMRSAGISLPGTTNVVDNHDGGKAKLIQNIVSWRSIKQKDGSLKEEPVLDRVRFDKTNILRITAKQNETYGFMMRHNACKNNPFREASATALYYLVNPREAAMKTIKDEDLQLDARLLIRNGSPTDLKAITKKLGLDDSKNVEVIRAELIKRAIAAPLSVINASNDQVMKAKLRVREAIELNFIAYESSDGLWYWADSSKHPVIVTTPENRDPLEHLMSFVQQEDGREFYHQLLSKLKSFDGKLNGS